MTHKPATPLPWTFVEVKPQYSGDDRAYEINAGDKPLLDNQRYYNHAPGYDDADYLCRAANAYPLLVAALHKAMNQIDALNGNDGEFAAYAKLPDARTTNAYIANRALLLELGE